MVKICMTLPLACMSALAAYAQPKQGLPPTQASTSPVEVVSKVADRVLAHTPFVYKLKAVTPKPAFDNCRVINFGGNYPQAVGGDMAYAYSEIGAERDTTIVLQLSFGGALKIFANGEEVFRKTAAPGNRKLFQQTERAITLSDSCTIRLRKGQNALLIKSVKGGTPWQVYLQPKNATVEFSPVRHLSFGLQNAKNIDATISATSDVLLSGPYQAPSAGLDILEGPEKSATFNPLMAYGTSKSWRPVAAITVPDLTDVQPLWGSYDTYNYHAAGLAWAIANLGVYTKNQRFVEFEGRYGDFILKSILQTRYAVDSLGQFLAPQHHLINTHLLDFTTAPTLPFAQRLILEKDFPNRASYQQRVDSIANYALRKQVRLPDGTFTRETPVRYTTWVDDMFMGIPFLVYAAQATTNAQMAATLREEAIKQVLSFNKNVYDAKANLYYHARYAVNPVAIPHWARANGWGIFATSIVLESLPATHPQYKAILNIYKKHIDALAKLQDGKSGFWHQVLDDASSYEETSATAIFTLALARGLRLGWIKGDKYENAAKAGWQAVLSQTEPDGTVHNICIGTMSSETDTYYKTRPLADNDSHGLLGVIWAGIEMDKWLKSQK